MHARPAVRQNTITRNELTVYGSYVGVNTFPRAISILERGVIKPSALMSAVVPLEQLTEALDLLRSGQRDEGRDQALTLDAGEDGHEDACGRTRRDDGSTTPRLHI